MYASTCIGRNFACCGGLILQYVHFLKFSYRIIVRFFIFGNEVKRRGGRGVKSDALILQFASCVKLEVNAIPYISLFLEKVGFHPRSLVH